MRQLDMTAVRNIENKINDCTSVAQIRKVFNTYKVYLYNETVKQCFDNRIEYLTDKAHDDFTKSLVEGFLDDYEDEIEKQRNCSNLPAKNKIGRKSYDPLEAKSELEVEIVIVTKEGKFFKDTFKELVKVAIDKSQGNKNEAARLLGIKFSRLNSYIKKNPEVSKHLKSAKNKIRKAAGYL